MKRRHPFGSAPPELCVFDVDAWVPTGVALDDPWRPTLAHRAWIAARAAWAADRGGEDAPWPPGADDVSAAVCTPDEPFDWDEI